MWLKVFACILDELILFASLWNIILARNKLIVKKEVNGNNCKMCVQKEMAFNKSSDKILKNL